MNCPKCGSAMMVKEKPAITYEKDGAKSLKGTQEVWFCRDCKICIGTNSAQRESAKQER